MRSNGWRSIKVLDEVEVLLQDEKEEPDAKEATDDAEVLFLEVGKAGMTYKEKKNL